MVTQAQVPPEQLKRILSALSRGRTQQPQDMTLANQLLAQSPELRLSAERGEGSPIITGLSQARKDVIKGRTVFINGQGFSVAPEKREAFIREQTGAGRSVQFKGRTFQPRTPTPQTTFQRQAAFAAKTPEQKRAAFLPQAVRRAEERRVRQPSKEIIAKARDPTFIEKLLTGKIVPIGLGAGIPGTTPALEARPLKELFTKPGFKFLEKELGIGKKDIVKFVSLSDASIDRTLNKSFPFVTDKQRDKIKDLAAFQRGVVEGTLMGIEEKPEQIVALTAASFLAPGVIAAGGKLSIAKRILSRIPAPVKKRGVQSINTALGGLYLTASGLAIAGEPTPEEKGRKVGEILTVEAAPFVVGTKLGVKSLLKKEITKELNTEINKLPPNKRAAFEEYMNQAEILGRFEPRTKNIKLNNVESLPNLKSQKAMRDYLRLNKNEVSVGGSVAQTGQLNVKRKLGDLDLYLETKNPKQAARELESFLKSKGVERVTISPKNPTTVTVEGKKLADFNDIERLLTNIKQVIPFWQNPRRYIIKTPEGIRIQRVGLQVRRKLIAAFADPKRLATGKYKKDLQDFKSIADSLFKKAELNARRSFFFRETKIKQLEKQFGVKVSRKLPEKVPTIFKKPKIEKVKKPIFIKKPKKFRESPLIQRAKVKAKQKFFSKLKPSQSSKIKKTFIRLKPSQPFTKLKKPKRFIPSQVPTKPRKAPRLVPPSQPKIIPKKPSILIPPTFRRPPLVPPSQPPVRPPKRPPIIPPRLVPPSQPPVRPPKRPTILIPPKAPIPPKFLKKKLSKEFRGAESFDVRVRRNKVFRTIEKRLPFNLALQTLTRNLDVSLRASGRLRPNIKTPLKPDVPRLRISSKLFRRPKPSSPLFKKDTLTIIERANKRLSVKKEVSDIHKARRAKLR